MKRLTSDALEALAFARGRLIEFDEAQGIMVLRDGRVTYYATVEPHHPSCPARAGDGDCIGCRLTTAALDASRLRAQAVGS